MRIFVIIIALTTVSCSNSSQPSSTATPQPTIVTTPTPAFNELIADTVILKFKAANLPVVDEVKFTEETDGNNLLGRPGQYIGKINFSDKRTKGKAAKQGNSIEIFATAEDLERRKTYTETISKSGGMFLQYIYSHKNVLLRLDHQLLPKEAAEYEAVLKSL